MRQNRKINRRGGQVIVIVALSLVALLGLAGLALDGGNLYTQRRQMQNAADAGALSGARLLSINEKRDSVIFQEITRFAALNKVAATSSNVVAYYTDSSEARVGSISNGSGNAPNSAIGVEVYANNTFPTFFLGVLGIKTAKATARAVAVGSSSKSGIGVLVLNPTAQGALTLSGSAAMNVKGSVIVDSNSSKAATSSGSAGLTSTELDVTGNYSSSGSSFFKANPVKTGVAPTADFLADVPVPDPSTMTIRSTSTYSPASGETLQPGVYIGGINISSKPNVTFAPGIYYLQGGGFNMSGGSSTLTALGVMIYNGVGSNGTTGSVTVSGGGAVTMTPPANGPYQGMALFQDRASTQKVTLSGGSAWDFTGTVYARSAHMDISGGSGGKMGSQYVSDTLTLSGSSTFQDIDPDGGYKSGSVRLTQ